MAKKLSGKYLLKNTSDGSYADVTSTFDGVNILSVGGLDAVGKAVNIYTAQWVNNQDEDFLITTLDENENPVVVRENVDITVTFVVGNRYAASTIDTQYVFDTFVAYMTGSDVWVASTYVGKQVHCVALDKFSPKEVKLHRGTETYILGEITLHTLEKPSQYQ